MDKTRVESACSKTTTFRRQIRQGIRFHDDLDELNPLVINSLSKILITSMSRPYGHPYFGRHSARHREAVAMHVSDYRTHPGPGRPLYCFEAKSSNEVSITGFFFDRWNPICGFPD